ncbi:MAG: hypothetical protein WBN02_05865, partial [Sedimenticolaceae bacterium]
AKFSRANRRCDWNRERNVFSTASDRFSMPMMLQQTPRNFKDFRAIQFSEGTGYPSVCEGIQIMKQWAGNAHGDQSARCAWKKRVDRFDFRGGRRFDGVYRRPRQVLSIQGDGHSRGARASTVTSHYQLNT